MRMAPLLQGILLIGLTSVVEGMKPKSDPKPIGYNQHCSSTLSKLFASWYVIPKCEAIPKSRSANSRSGLYIHLDKIGERLVVGVGCHGRVVAVDGAGRRVGV